METKVNCIHSAYSVAMSEVADSVSKSSELEAGRKVVVVAIDDSEASRHAFLYAVDRILRPGDHLRLVHCQSYREVIGSSHMGNPIYSTGVIQEKSKEIARAFARQCKDLGLKDFREHIILEDVPAGQALVEYISELPQHTSDDITLVLGSREIGFFKKAFIGSTSSYCVNHCHCPVIVVKLPVSRKKT